MSGGFGARDDGTMSIDYSVRPESPDDRDAVHQLNAAAFGREGEAVLVDALRDAGAALVSLVAEHQGTVIGHILFSPVSIEGHGAAGPVAGLAPMAVQPGLQRKGVGSALVRAGLAACSERGQVACVVLGHPAFYPQFGFAPAHTHGLRCVYDVPAEVFMAMELLPGALSLADGIVHYHPAFAAV